MNNTKLNIVFIPISLFRGMAGSKRLRNLAVNLIDYKNISLNNIIVGNSSESDCEHSYLSKHIRCFNVNYRLTNPLTIFVLYFKIFSFLKKIYRKGTKNILYNYGYPNIKNIVPLLLARLIGYKLVFDIVEDNSKIVSFKSILSKFKIATSLYLFKHLSWFADGAIGISYYLVDKLKSVSKSKLPVIHLPISIDTKRFSEKSAKSPPDLNRKIKIFYGGSFGEKDGLNFLLKAFDKMAEAFISTELILTGKGLQRDMDRFYESLKEIRNKEKIKIMGFVSDEKYYQLLISADIHCMTRTNSEFANAGFPFKLGEMLATGAPVICTGVGDVKKYLTHMKDACIIKPENIKQLIDAMILFLGNEKLRISIGSQGRLLAIRNFDAKLHSERLLAFLYTL